MIFYVSIFKKIQEDLQRYERNQANAEGKAEGMMMTIIEVLIHKLGGLSDETRNVINECSVNKLEKLIKHIFEMDSEKDIMSMIMD